MLVEDIKRGLIARVVVYELDCISRSILDFANMMALFHKLIVDEYAAGIVRRIFELRRTVSSMNRTGTRSCKGGRRVSKPSSQWICCTGTHEAMIPQDVWETVQRIRPSAVHPGEGRRQEYPFSGKLWCADCGSALSPNIRTCKCLTGPGQMSSLTISRLTGAQMQAASADRM